MARRKKPQIKGTDPSYDHSFERFRPIPNDMPPDVIVPGVKNNANTVDPQPSEKQPAPVKKPAPKKATKQASPPPPTPHQPTAEPAVSERQTTLDAAVKVEQAKRMATFEEKGLKMKDIVTLAGRRATERFTLSSTFVPKPEAERLPMKQGYHTSKRLDGKVLDAMRKEQDPLGISSDPAMVRGQFELLFWACLDEVIKELKAKY